MGSIIMEPDDIAAYGGNIKLNRNFTTVCTSVGRIQSKGIFMKTNPLHYSVPLLLLQLSLATLVTLLLCRLLRPLGQPTVVPQILGGIILGPSLMGRITELTRLVFPLRGFIVLDMLSMFAFMLYFFLVGVQMDPSIIKKLDRKTLTIGISTVVVPILLTTTWAYLLATNLILDENIVKSLPAIALAESVMAFPIIASFLTELKILNSEFGRVALSSSMISGFLNFFILTLTVLWLQESDNEKPKMLETVFTGFAFVAVIYLVLRPAVLRMTRQIPEGEPMKEECIFAVLLGALLTGFWSQAIGLHIFFGPFVFGMIIPAGPPLGSALVDKIDLIISWVFMPIYFVKNGLVIDIFAVKPKNYFVVQFIILLGSLGKLLGAFLPSVFYKMPVADAFLLGLVMNAQGALELGLFKILKRSKAIDHESFVVMCTSMMVVTGSITPIIRYLYDRSRKYIIHKRRTVLHSTPNTELRVLVCIHDEENVHTTIDLLQALHPTRSSPMAIYVLHLVELVGSASPLLIPHKLTKKRLSSKATTSQRIVNAFRCYEEINHGVASVQSFTAISPYTSMHDEVCTVALDRRISLIIIPFNRKFTVSRGMELFKKAVRIMNNKVLDKAPCSVATLVDRGLLNSSRNVLADWSSYHVAILFLGGADDREALAIGIRMVEQENINLTMVQILEDRNITGDDVEDRQLDNELVSEFRLCTAGNHRVIYKEEVVTDCSGTVAVIQSMENHYELLIVGRHHDEQSSLTAGLTDWNEHSDLGIIGDLLASTDFKSNTTILVVQQHAYIEYEQDEKRTKSFGKQYKDFSQDMTEEDAEDSPIRRKAVW